MTTNNNNDEENFFSDDYNGIDWASIPLPDSSNSSDRQQQQQHFKDDERMDVIVDQQTTQDNMFHNRSITEAEAVGRGGDGHNVTMNRVIGVSNTNNSEQEKHLKEQIERLQSMVSQKDTTLFDLESTIASLEAETSSRIQKSQQDCTNQIKAMQDELRTLNQEMDKKNLTILKLKKRQRDTSYSMGGRQNTTTPPPPPPPPQSIKKDNDSMEGRANNTSSPMMTTTSIMDNKEDAKNTDNDATMSSTQRLALHLLEHYNPIIATTTQGKEEMRSEWQTKEYQRDEYRIRTILTVMATNSRDLPFPIKEKSLSFFGMHHFARELIGMLVSKFPSFILRTTTTCESPTVETTSTRNNDTKQDTVETNSVNDTNQEELMGMDTNNKDASIISCCWSCVEMIVSMLSQVCSYSAETRCCVRYWICLSHNEEHETTTNSFTDPLSVLSRIRGITTKIDKQRIVSATCNMKECFGTTALSTVKGRTRIIRNDTDDSDTLIINNDEEYAIAAWGDEQHRNDACQRLVKILSNIMIGRDLSEWWVEKKENIQMIPSPIPISVRLKSIALLQNCLYDAPREVVNKEEGGGEVEVNYNSIWVLMMENLIIPRQFTSKYQSATDDDDGRKIYSSAYWYDLISTLEERTNIPRIHPVGRRDYLKWIEEEQEVTSSLNDDEGRRQKRNLMENNSRTELKDNSKGKYKNESVSCRNPNKEQLLPHTSTLNENFQTKNVTKILSIKSSTIQLFYKLIYSSTRARHLLFVQDQRFNNPNFRSGVTIARRFVALILDDLQGFIVPYLTEFSESHPPHDNNRNDKEEKCATKGQEQARLLEPVLLLCLNETLFVTLLCESLSAMILMKTLMKVRSVVENGDEDFYLDPEDAMNQENTDSEAGIAIMVDVLEICVRVSMQDNNERFHDAPFHDDFKRNEISRRWSAIVDSALAFFLLASFHFTNQEYTELDNGARRERNATVTDHNSGSFGSIISAVKRMNQLCSSCTMIIDSKKIAGFTCFEDGAMNQAKLILQELIDDDD